MSDNNDHAFYNPSGAEAWLQCSGFAHIKHKAPPQVTNEYMAEGTEAHKWIDGAWKIIDKGALNSDVEDYFKHLLKENPEMWKYVTDYLEFVHDETKRFTKGATDVQVFAETKVRFTKENWGTLDRCVVCRRKGELQALFFDYKHGQGVVKEAEENPQLLNYLIAKDRELKGKLGTCWLYIYQPRVPADEPYTKWKVTKDVRNEWKVKFEKALERNEKVRAGTLEAHYKPGDWCRFCPCAPICPGLMLTVRKESLSVIDQARPIIPDVKVLSLNQKINIFRHRHLFKKFITAVEEDLHARMANGLDDDRLKFVRGRSVRKWRKNRKRIADFLKKFDVNPWKERELINLTDAEKQIGKGKLGKYTVKPEGSLQLVMSDDKREGEGVDSLSVIDPSKVR